MDTEALVADQKGVLGALVANFARRVLIAVVWHVLVLLALVVLGPDLDFVLSGIVVVPGVLLIYITLWIVVIDRLRRFLR